MHIHAGVQQTGPQIRFSRDFEVVELTRMLQSRLRESTLKKLRQDAPENARFVVPAPLFLTDPQWELPASHTPDRDARGFAPGPELERVVTQLHRSAGLLRAQTLLLVTPPSFRPTTTGIDRLVAFAKHPRLKSMRLIWEPRGLWQEGEIRHVVSQTGIVTVTDPLLTRELPNHDFGYFRIHGPASAGILGEHHHHRILEACFSHKRVFVVFCTPNAVRDARAFLATVQGSIG